MKKTMETMALEHVRMSAACLKRAEGKGGDRRMAYQQSARHNICVWVLLKAGERDLKALLKLFCTNRDN